MTIKEILSGANLNDKLQWLHSHADNKEVTKALINGTKNYIEGLTRLGMTSGYVCFRIFARRNMFATVESLLDQHKIFELIQVIEVVYFSVLGLINDELTEHVRRIENLEYADLLGLDLSYNVMVTGYRVDNEMTILSSIPYYDHRSRKELLESSRYAAARIIHQISEKSKRGNPDGKH